MPAVAIVCPHCFLRNRVPAERMLEAPRCGGCHEPLFIGRPLPVNTDQFRRMIAGNDIPVIVDFWAAWCVSSRMFAPVFAKAGTLLEPGIRLLKLDTEQNQTITAQYHILSIPTLAIFKGGEEVARTSEVLTPAQFLDWVRGVAV